MQIELKLVGALTSKPYAFSARSWELESLDFVDFYDSMLSTVRVDVRGLSILRVLPRINERLNEEWISDKIRFSYDGFRRQRLLNPLLKTNSSFVPVTWEESFFAFYLNYNLKNYDSFNSKNGVSAYFGNFIDLESLSMFKEFISSLKYSYNNLDSVNNLNFSGFIPSNFLGNKDLVSSLSKNDCILLIGNNLRYLHPIIHVKIARLSNQGVPVFTQGVPSNVKIKAYSFGYSLKSFILFLKGKNKYSLVLTKSKNPLVLMGESFGHREDIMNSNQIFNLLKNFKIKVSFLVSNPTVLGALGLGLEKNKIKNHDFFFNYNYNSDNVYSDGSGYNIYHGHHGDAGAANSNLVFPSTFLLEKSGSFLNLEGNFVDYNFVIKPGTSVRTDWRIFKALGLYFGSVFAYEIRAFKDIKKLISIFLPSYTSGKLIDSKKISFDKKIFFRFENTPATATYNNFYMADQVSRSSRIMALSFVKLKDYYINF